MQSPIRRSWARIRPGLCYRSECRDPHRCQHPRPAVGGESGSSFWCVSRPRLICDMSFQTCALADKEVDESFSSSNRHATRSLMIYKVGIQILTRHAWHPSLPLTIAIYIQNHRRYFTDVRSIWYGGTTTVWQVFNVVDPGNKPQQRLR